MGQRITAGPSAFGNTITDDNLNMNGSAGVPGDLVFNNLFGGGSVTLDFNPTTGTDIIGFPNNTGDVPITGNATAPPTLGQKIGKVNLTGQTGSIASTNLVRTTASDGFYLVQVYMVCTSAGAAGNTVAFNMTWNDGSARSKNSLVTIDTATLGNTAQGTLPVYNAGSANIAYSTTRTGGTYTIRVRVTFLGT